MNWSSKSANINPFEHAWKAVRRVIAQHNSFPRTDRELEMVLSAERTFLTQTFIGTYISNMKARIKVCIAVHGGWIPY